MVSTKISGYFIGILLFTLVIVGGVSMMGIFRGYDSDWGEGGKLESFNASFNKLDDVRGVVNNLDATVSNVNGTDFGAFGVLNSLIKSSWQVLKLMTGNLDFMYSIYESDTLGSFNIPLWIGGIIVMIVIVVIVFAIFGAIFQRDL